MMRPPGQGLRARLALTLGSFCLDVDLELRGHETLVLLGPNGSGKTTCLDLVAGLRAPDSGHVVLGETVLYDTETGVDLAPEERRVGFVFQDFALFPHRTVRGNVGYGPRARRFPSKQRRQVIDSCLLRMDLTALADRFVTELSGGQRQRVALARALASEARILLLDEPFASLDATIRATVRSELRGFLRDTGLPALVVTHDPLDAFVVGDRLAVIEQGRVVQVGTGEDLLAHPRTPFVADLVGLNVFEVDLASGAGLKTAHAGAVTFHVLADELAGTVHLAFAPSDVALAAEPPTGSFQNVIRVRVRESLGLPDRLRVVLDAGLPMVADITREAGRGLPLAPGSAIWAMIKATSIRVYP
jgi:molybdate transport system ATP-binding protein